MNEKWTYAQGLVDNGHTNADILAAVRAKFGSGISTSKLTEWRATAMERLADSHKTRKREKEAKWAFVRECLVGTDMSVYAIQKACRDKFDSGVGFYKVQQMQEEMKEVSRMENAIMPVEIPPEVREEDLDTTVPPPDGSLTGIKAVQSWMKKINAKSLTLNEGGDLSVIVEHNFNIGEPNE